MLLALLNWELPRTTLVLILLAETRERKWEKISVTVFSMEHLIFIEQHTCNESWMFPSCWSRAKSSHCFVPPPFLSSEIPSPTTEMITQTSSTHFIKFIINLREGKTIWEATAQLLARNRIQRSQFPSAPISLLKSLNSSPRTPVLKAV